MPEEVSNATPAETPLTGSSTVTTTPTETTETEGFDASAFEVDYGLPENTLEGVADQATAMERLRAYTDKMMSAGLLSSELAAPPETPKSAETPAPKAGESKPSDTEGLYEKVMKAIDDKFAAMGRQSEEAQMAQALREVDRRIVAEIDRWESMKYGKEGSRNYKQLKAVKELRKLAQTHYAGHISQGTPAPAIELLMRQVRAFDDPDYVPVAKPKSDAKPLGTPGTARTTVAGGEGPRNIHQAVMTG